MRQITAYEAEDGSMFTTLNECLDHEHRQAMADKIEQDLSPLWGITSGEILEWIFANADFILKALTINKKDQS